MMAPYGHVASLRVAANGTEHGPKSAKPGIALKGALRGLAILAFRFAGKERVSQGNSKLTSSDVLEIRSLAKSGELYKTIALAKGVKEDTVGDIVRRKSWKHV